MPCRVWRVSGEELLQFFHRSIKNMKLRAEIAEHILGQFRSRYLDFHCSTPHERYNQLLSRCPGIVEHLLLNAIASFLRSTSGRFACKERHAADALPNPQGLASSRRRKNAFGAQE